MCWLRRRIGGGRRSVIALLPLPYGHGWLVDAVRAEDRAVRVGSYGTVRSHDAGKIARYGHKIARHRRKGRTVGFRRKIFVGYENYYAAAFPRRDLFRSNLQACRSEPQGAPMVSGCQIWAVHPLGGL